MFIGHYALGFGSKRPAPDVSLGALFFACQWADLLWPILVMAGVESFTIRPGITAVTPLDFQHYPYSHSLLALLVSGAVLGLMYRTVSRSSLRGAIVLGTAVIHAFICQRGVCEMRYALGLRHYPHEDPRGVNVHRRQAELVRGEAQRSVL